jgi:hypothetical protein
MLKSVNLFDPCKDFIASITNGMCNPCRGSVCSVVIELSALILFLASNPLDETVLPLSHS